MKSVSIRVSQSLDPALDGSLLARRRRARDFYNWIKLMNIFVCSIGLRDDLAWIIHPSRRHKTTNIKF